MNNILSSPAPSEVLNTEVASDISKHLFLVCNYNPNSIEVFSTDAKFTVGVLNMYSFLIDASICAGLIKIANKYSLKSLSKLVDIVDEICSLRTFLAHNEDYRNGTEDDRIKAERWFSNTIGKKVPESVGDYEKPLSKLVQYGNETFDALQIFIQEVAKHRRVNDIIADWEEEIISFYKKPIRKNIFMGNLKMSFKARVLSTFA